jgi:hypothetical protein
VPNGRIADLPGARTLYDILRDKATYAFFSSFVIVMPSIISVTPFMTQPNSWPT